MYDLNTGRNCNFYAICAFQIIRTFARITIFFQNSKHQNSAYFNSVTFLDMHGLHTVALLYSSKPVTIVITVLCLIGCMRP